MNYAITISYDYLSIEYILTLLTAFISFIIGFYLLITWKMKKQNLSGIIWGISLFLLSISLLLRNTANTGDFNLFNLSKSEIGLFRWIFLELALIGFYFGVARLIVRRKLLKVYFPAIYFLAILFLTIFRTEIFATSSKFVLLLSTAYLGPISLFLAVVFFMLAGVLLAEKTKFNYGSAIIGIAWVMISIKYFLLHWFVVNNYTIHYHTISISAFIILFIGLVVLNIETHHAFKDLEEDKKHHHHFK